MGMEERTTYLVTKTVKDKFFALSNKNILTTWDSLTGKFKNEYNAKTDKIDFSKYKIFRYGDPDLIYMK